MEENHPIIKEPRTPFPGIFWTANIVEVLERFAYYGIYIPFGIYMQQLGFSMGELGVVQSIFLLFSYGIPVVSGTFADKFGFKKVLIISYLAYLPSILLLILTRTFSGIALTMLSIGLAAGIFKPLIAGTVRAVTDKTNKTLGFGVFYAMVNLGASLGPFIMGKLRAVSWNTAFMAGAVAIGIMLLFTIFFYKEPKREIEGITLGQKFRDMAVAFSDWKFDVFILLLGVFFWLPFWAFFNLCALYVDSNIDTARLYLNLQSVFGTGFANFLSHEVDGTKRILGETIAHSGYIIVVFQILVSRIVERFKAIPTFLTGLFVAAVGFGFLGYAKIAAPSLIFLGIFLFAFGEMISSPRIQEYITWIAPKEKAGLYMGLNFVALLIGSALSGVTYTSLYGVYNRMNHPEYLWFTVGIHLVMGLVLVSLFLKKVGEFKEREE